MVALLMGASLFAGPCGITTLQARDFLTTSLVRSGVVTLFSIVEASLINMGN